MPSIPLSYAKTSALLSCIYLGLLHYALILMLLAANLTQEVAFVPLLFALLALPHATIGFVSGYGATKYQLGAFTTIVVTVLGFVTGLFGAFSTLAILTAVFPVTQRPIVQHMLAYVIALGVIGTCSSVVWSTLSGLLHQALRQK